ncbi:hypothetical protein BGZ83_006592 [Gryganskiella cystojenkinii]|nr:hypothetical protein BGZ83_006592 [Gryganskiella cystojenkinii]
MSTNFTCQEVFYGNNKTACTTYVSATACWNDLAQQNVTFLCIAQGTQYAGPGRNALNLPDDQWAPYMCNSTTCPTAHIDDSDEMCRVIHLLSRVVIEYFQDEEMIAHINIGRRNKGQIMDILRERAVMSMDPKVFPEHVLPPFLEQNDDKDVLVPPIRQSEHNVRRLGDDDHKDDWQQL